MNPARFIAKRFRSQTHGAFAGTVSKMTVISVAIAVMVLIVAFAILGGFKNHVREKIFSFDGHMHITKYSLTNTYESGSISSQNPLFKQIKSLGGVKSCQSIAYQKAILHANDQVAGVMIKGVGPEFKNGSFTQNMTSGFFIGFHKESESKGIVISDLLANRLLIKPGKKVSLYFFENGQLKPRKVKVTGTYSTGVEEFDERVILADIKLIQRLKGWDTTQVGGFEVVVDNHEKMQSIGEKIFKIMPYDMQMSYITDTFSYIFDWLNLLNQNVNVFIFILFVIAFFNISSTMYIMIMERLNMIGTLKALGATNGFIRKVFLYTGMHLLIKGLFWGNALGLAVCAIQYYFHIIPLDPENYYMNTVPIYWDWLSVFFINLSAIVLVLLIMLLPIWTLSNISPIKTIKFD